MHWTKPVVPIVVLALCGCATQDTLLPETEDTMLDIYRGAMTVPGQNDSTPLRAEDVCQALPLEDAAQSIEDCEDTVRAHASTRYQQLDAQPAGEDLTYLPYTRDVATEIENLFPRLENPDIVIYVYPHLATRTRAPIPGYSTVIPLYDRVQYRLPGESQRTTPSALPGAAMMTTEHTQDTSSGAGQGSSNPRHAPDRHHKSSHLEGHSLAPESAPEGAPKTAPGDAAREWPDDIRAEEKP